MSEENNLKPTNERVESEQESARSNQKAELFGDGTVAKGTENKAVGKGGILNPR